MCGALQTEGHIRLTLMGHPAYTPTKPPSCRPGALTRRPDLVHNENCCWPGAQGAWRLAPSQVVQQPLGNVIAVLVQNRTDVGFRLGEHRSGPLDGLAVGFFGFND